MRKIQLLVVAFAVLLVTLACGEGFSLTAYATATPAPNFEATKVVELEKKVEELSAKLEAQPTPSELLKQYLAPIPTQTAKVEPTQPAVAPDAKKDFPTEAPAAAVPAEITEMEEVDLTLNKGCSDDAFIPAKWTDAMFAYRFWQGLNGKNAPWLAVFRAFAEKPDQFTLVMKKPMAFELKGDGLVEVHVTLDNRAQEQMKARNDANAGKHPFDVFCAGDKHCDEGRISIYLDKTDGGTAEIVTIGGPKSLQSDWYQILLPPKGGEDTLILRFKLVEGVPVRFHFGGSEKTKDGTAWHNGIEIPTR